MGWYQHKWSDKPVNVKQKVDKTKTLYNLHVLVNNIKLFIFVPMDRAVH